MHYALCMHISYGQLSFQRLHMKIDTEFKSKKKESQRAVCETFIFITVLGFKIAVCVIDRIW